MSPLGARTAALTLAALSAATLCATPLRAQTAAEQQHVAVEAALAVEAGIALCNTRHADAYEHLLQARQRWDANSGTWNQIAKYLPRVPPPSDQRTPTSAREYAIRGLARAERGESKGAMEDLFRCGMAMEQLLYYDRKSPWWNRFSMAAPCRVAFGI